MKYQVTHDGLNCIFCGKLCKNLNSLTQHELRCGSNPNRKAHDNFGKYYAINGHPTKGKTKETSSIVAKYAIALKKKYDDGYISPLKGRHTKLTNADYIYAEHNQTEIQKWLSYVDTINITIPTYEYKLHNEGYQILSGGQHRTGNAACLTFVHNWIANLLLSGNLTATNVVHHIDSNRSNNDMHNLLVFATKTDHKIFHANKFAYLYYDELTHLFSCKAKNEV